MSNKLKDRDVINQNVKALSKTLNAACYDIGFLDGSIDNPLVNEKIGNSFSGHTLEIAIRAVIQKTLLFVTRSWDENSDSIPKILKRIRGFGPELEKERRERRPSFPDSFIEVERVETKISQLISDADVFVNKPAFKAARLHRDEYVAHSLEGQSGFGRKLAKGGIKVDSVTYRQTIELAKETAEFVSRILQIWDFTLKDPHDWINQSRKNTELFWKIIPQLSHLEDRQS